MPRAAAPRWNPRTNCWYANVGPPDPDGRATEVYFRSPVGDPPVPAPSVKSDQAGAWVWLQAYRKAGERKVETGESLTIRALCEQHLDWAEEEVERGRITRVHYRNRILHLNRLIGFSLPGGIPYGDRRADDLRHHDLAAMVDSWKKSKANPGGLSPHYLRNIVASVLAIYAWAARPVAGRSPERLLASNPLEKFDRPKVPNSPERYAERGMAAAFLAFYRNHADRVEKPRRRVAPSGSVSFSRRRSKVAGFERQTILLVRLLMKTGARPGEACVLEWGDIRWDARLNARGHRCANAVIPVDRWKAGKKTGKVRTIYLPATLTRALRRAHAREGRHPVRVFTHGRGKGGKGSGQPWPSGSRLSKAILRVRRAAEAAAREADRKAEAGEELTPAERCVRGRSFADDGPNRVVNYLWRHTAISSMLREGENVPMIAKLTGTSPEMIYRTYGHLLDSDLADVADRFDARRKATARFNAPGGAT